MVVSKKVLDTLIPAIAGFSQINGDYTIKSVRKVTKLIKAQIPYTTGGYFYGDEIPSYLAGFEDYYTFTPSPWGGAPFYKLKKEYEKARPYYSIEITYNEFDVEFTEAGKAKMEQRYAQHKRLMEKYGAICEALAE